MRTSDIFTSSFHSQFPHKLLSRVAVVVVKRGHVVALLCGLLKEDCGRTAEPNGPPQNQYCPRVYWFLLCGQIYRRCMWAKQHTHTLGILFWDHNQFQDHQECLERDTHRHMHTHTPPLVLIGSCVSKLHPTESYLWRTDDTHTQRHNKSRTTQTTHGDASTQYCQIFENSAPAASLTEQHEMGKHTITSGQTKKKSLKKPWPKRNRKSAILVLNGHLRFNCSVVPS